MKQFISMSMIGVITFGALFAPFQNTWAGGSVGNGGNAVVCYTDSTKKYVTSVELFDYWEMGQVYANQYQLELPAPDSPVLTHVQAIVNRMLPFDSYRAKSYQALAASIYGAIDQELYDEDLPVIDDDHPRFLPHPPCYKEQFAIQIRNPAAGQNRFMVSRRIWTDPHTSNLVRAGIIMHEVAYREFIENGATNSDQVRIFNFLVASNALDNASVVQYQQFLAQFHLATVGVTAFGVKFGGAQFVVQLRNDSMKQTGNQFEGDLAVPVAFNGSDYQAALQPMASDSHTTIVLAPIAGSTLYTILSLGDDFNLPQQNEITYTRNGDSALIAGGLYDWTIGFYPDGSFKIGEIDKGMVTAKTADGVVKCGAGEIGFYPNQVLRGCNLAEKHQFQVGSQKLWFSHIYYNAQGWIEGGRLAQPTAIFPVEGCSGTFSVTEGSDVAFDADGKLDMPKTKKQPVGLNDQFTFEGWSTTLQFPITYTYQGVTQNDPWISYGVKVNGCQLEESFEFEVLNKDDQALSLSHAYSDDQLKKIAAAYCKSEHFDDVYTVDPAQKTNQTMFAKVLDIDLMKSREVAIGTPYLAPGLRCLKKVNLKY